MSGPDGCPGTCTPQLSPGARQVRQEQVLQFGVDEQAVKRICKGSNASVPAESCLSTVPAPHCREPWAEQGGCSRPRVAPRAWADLADVFLSITS